MDNREIARALGRSGGATKVLIHRAIKQLEELVRETGGQEEQGPEEQRQEEQAPEAQGPREEQGPQEDQGPKEQAQAVHTEVPRR
jgi:hypothetical protein